MPVEHPKPPIEHPTDAAPPKPPPMRPQYHRSKPLVSDMQDMRNCYDSLLSAAATTANSAYGAYLISFPVSLACKVDYWCGLLENPATNLEPLHVTFSPIWCRSSAGSNLR
ncbi:hypothetical protein RHMOL_Rhmol13G0174500 [Rhododendron molle]|uniref:Uncharacterized protein n=1 Tax=Rhododendron molle TaxID=49168 RepID=A0ACC0L820_RHOML|nr:hypothetical protein RHMOL_Rhmol13G0174500 [Rhododendron molle]